ncbi:metabolite-proton symporter [Izhakiella australiensis]|uniref:Metabolite-proton symporter n=1 Tax=Izhakiella australiensis TaxID=1926881 RepID=A0A1S8YSE5_9GAMM|nr:MFS transporter [Izhakiella australiensis]OON42000.1 metabolite-proton symporter [Izhakiella australiensis]
MSVATPLPARQKRVLIASAIGNFIEWYEFAVYGFMATLIAQHFFQLKDTSGLTSLILTYAAFAVAFFFRPLGALLFGRLGDRYGRKPTLIAVVLMMTLSTVAIGLVPTYAAIDVAAPLLVTALRILQGLFAGGEYGGAVSLMTESAPPGKRGLYGAWQSLTVALGLLAGVAVVAALPLLIGESAMNDWGWRVPFLLALPMGIVALWLRSGLEESSQFRQAKDNQQTTASTGATLRAILLGIARLMVWSAAGYTYLVIMPTYLQAALHTAFNQALIIAVVSNLGFAVTILPAGILSDRFGRRPLMLLATLLLLVLAFPLLKILQDPASTLWVKTLAVFVAGALVGILAGPGPAMLAEMFPTHVRYTGLGLAYSLSNAVFSGGAGLIITGLMRQTGNLDIPAWYVAGTALVSFFALLTLGKNDHQKPL